MGGTEQMGGSGDINGHAVVSGVGHLTGDEPAPDELVQLVLLRRQTLAHSVRVQVHIRGTDGLVGVLSAGLGLEGAGGLRIKFRAIVVDDIGCLLYTSYINTFTGFKYQCGAGCAVLRPDRAGLLSGEGEGINRTKQSAWGNAPGAIL